MEYQEKAKKNKLPIQYKIYKGMGGNHRAMRLSLKRPYTNTNLSKPEGCVFLEMAPATGKNNYDWENQKVMIALSITDIPKIILFLRSSSNAMFNEDRDEEGSHCRIYHDKGAGSATQGQHVTTLDIFKSSDPSKTNFFFSMSQKINGSQSRASVPVSPDEAVAIGTLLQAAVPIIMSWQDYPESEEF